MSEWVVLLHVAVSFWFVAGLLGRNVTMARARSANDLSTLVELVDLRARQQRFGCLVVLEPLGARIPVQLPVRLHRDVMEETGRA